MYRVIPLGEHHLRHAIDELVTHYPRERNHQGLSNELIDGAASGTGRPRGSLNGTQDEPPPLVRQPSTTDVDAAVEVLRPLESVRTFGAGART